MASLPHDAADLAALGREWIFAWNSHDLERKPSGAMAKWLKADLERAQADWLIDVGPGAGNAGGRIVAAGTPLAGSKSKRSRTAPFLQMALAGQGRSLRVSAKPAIKSDASAPPAQT